MQSARSDENNNVAAAVTGGHFSMMFSTLIDNFIHDFGRWNSFHFARTYA